MSRFFFVVDTESYAGNFEREMGSFLTGVVGEYFPQNCHKLADRFDNETDEKFDFDSILAVHDHDGEHEPDYVAIWTTPGWFNDGMGGFYREGTDPEIVKKKYLEKVDKYENGHKGSRLSKSPDHYPAYLSVAIALDSEPSQSIIDLWKERATIFCKENKIKLTGFRLIHEVREYRERLV